MTEKSLSWLNPVLVIAGLVWSGRAAQEFTGPNYWNPRTPLDYTAVIGTSLAFLLLSVALVGLVRRYPLPATGKQKVWLVGMSLAIVATAVVGVSNFGEDAMGVKAFGSLFAFGGIGTVLGLTAATAGAFLHPQIRWRLGWFLLAIIAGFAFLEAGGGFVAGIAFLILASR